MKNSLSSTIALIKRPLYWYKRQSTRKKILLGILGMVVLLLLIQTIAGANATPQYEVEKVKKADITEVVVETGQVLASGRSDVYSPSTGVISELYVSNGDQVAENQDLFLVTSNASDSEKASAYASYQSALNALRTAEQTKLATQALLEQNRQAVLDAQNTVDYKNNNKTNPDTGKEYTELEKQSIDSTLHSARQTFQANEKKYKESDVAIAAAQAQVNAAWLAYQATQSVIVKAPSEGIVANLAVSQGGAVEAKQPASLATSTPVLAIASFTNPEIVVGLNETDSAKVSPGQEAEIEISSLNGRMLEGSVSRIDTIGTDNQGVMQYNAYITILSNDSQIRSGMTADVTITTTQRRNVLTVPNSAVKPYKGGRAVRVIDEKTKELKYIPIEIGIRGEERTEILKGLKEGVEVVTALPNDQIQRPGLF